MGISAEYPQKYPQNKKIQKNFAGRGWTFFGAEPPVAVLADEI